MTVASLPRLLALAVAHAPALAPALASLGMSGCGADQSFVVSEVDQATLAAGEHEVNLADFDRRAGSPTTLRVILEGDPDECRILHVTFCEEDAGHDLTSRSTVDGQYGCSDSEFHVPDAVFAGFVDTCSVYSEFDATLAAATIEVSEDEIHLVLRATMDGLGTTPGRFEVEVDVIAELSDGESGI